MLTNRSRFEPMGKGGFTLFELMVVLVIIGLMSVLVLPKIGGNFDSLKLKTETKKMATALRYARSRAVSENVTIRAKFDLDSGRVLIADDDEKTGIDYPWNTSVHLEDKPVVSYQLLLAEGVSMTFPREDAEAERTSMEIAFYPSGGSSGGIILITCGEKSKYRLMVDDVTGSVKVLEESGDAVG